MEAAVKQKIDTFFSQYPRRSFNKGQILIYAGDDPAGVYYVESGQVRQYDITESGEEVVVNVFKAPSFFPTSWLINKEPNQYFFETFTKVSVRIAPPSDALKFLKTHQDITFDLLGRVFSGVDGMQRRMAHLMGKSTRNRVIFELVVECKRFGKKQRDGSYVLAMHEAEFASRAGLARETVSRHLHKLKGGKAVTVTHKEMIVTDLPWLEEELSKGSI